VDGENQQFLLQGMVKFLRLRPGGFRGDQDFAFLFFQAETEHIGRPVVSEKLLVIAGNFPIAYQNNAEVFEG
jgi:hypothetical protein